MHGCRWRSLSASIALACGVCACGPTRLSMTPIGGDWYTYHHQSVLIEAGGTPSDIYRAWHGRRVLVASDINFHEYYKPQDCLLWETSSDPYVVAAACGDRQPIIVASDDYHRWTLVRRGLVHESEMRVNEQGVAVRPTSTVSIEAIAAESARQPAFSGGWSSAAPRIVGNLEPDQEDVPVDVNAANEYGRTALMEAMDYRYQAGPRLALVNALLESGANVNATDKYGGTALIAVAENGDAAVISRLLEAGAHVNATTDRGRTALMEAAGSLYNQVECVTMLLKAGANKYAQDKYGHTAYSAIRTNTDPQLKVLLAVQ